jgi:hypothetical protein
MTKGWWGGMHPREKAMEVFMLECGEVKDSESILGQGGEKEEPAL